MHYQQKFRLPVKQFCVNVFTAALMNSDSIIYHEDEGYDAGLIGYFKPFSQSLFSSYELIETLINLGRSPLEIDDKIYLSWTACQLKVCQNFGVFLNVLGLAIGEKSSSNVHYYTLHKFILAWTRKHWLRILACNPKIADACLIGWVSYDTEYKRLARTYRENLNGLSLKNICN